MNNYYNTSFIPYYDGQQRLYPNNTFYDQQQRINPNNVFSDQQQRFNPNNTYDANNMYNYPYSMSMPANMNAYLPNNMQANMQAYLPNNMLDYNPMSNQNTDPIQLIDYGPAPFAVNIEQATKQNNNFRTALWTGSHLQLTLMSINVGEDIGLELHPDVDQFLRIEQGQGLVLMGNRRDQLDFQAYVEDGFAFIVPAGTWHNLINTGNIPIKLYSIYAPPKHPHGTVHRTKADAQATGH